MITVLDSDMAPSAEWTDLIDELDRWGDEGRIATLWWRDDDAVACSGRLGELLAVANGVPMALAVIPALVETTLAEWLGKAAPASTRILQHGWQHTNHAGAGKKSEFPKSRSPGAVALDLMQGRERLMALFGSQALAVLAPPWNRFDDSLLPVLGESGIGGISRIKPRDVAFPIPPVFESNVHVDLVAWRADRGFVGEAAALGALVTHLRARRCGAVDRHEPPGILTHHLVQDAVAAAFLDRLLSLTLDHPAAEWLEAETVFAPAIVAVATIGQA
jgi:hypothetical protein